MNEQMVEQMHHLYSRVAEIPVCVTQLDFFTTFGYVPNAEEWEQFQRVIQEVLSDHITWEVLFHAAKEIMVEKNS